MRAFLLAWYVYLVVLALLMAASGGRRSLPGAFGVVAACGGAALGLSLIAPRFLPGGRLTLVATVTVLVAAVGGIATSRREDTRLIALLLAGASALPLLLYFWSPSG